MIVTDWIHTIAGFFILLTMALGVDCGNNPLFMHEYWLFGTAFIGLNLFQFGFTKFCPLGLILKAFGVPACRHK